MQSTLEDDEIPHNNEIYLARRPHNKIPSFLGELHLQTLNPRNLEVTNRFYEPSFSIRFQKIGAGLENLGNTCYLNSVLQCLTYTEPFAAYLQSGKHKSTCRKAGFCAMCALQNHVMDALQSTGKILRPFHLVKNLRCISSNFRNSRQEDAHEYMVNLLESMHKCCLPYGVSSESPGAYEKSQVHKIFGGQLRSQVKCMQCSYCSNKFDPFLDLSLEIMQADSIRKALSHFTAVELLDGGERQYQCLCCEEKVKAFKQLTIHKAPYVLTIHLKRFDSSIHGEKLRKKVVYGPTLNLNPFVSDPREGDYKYTLYGVLVHAGWTTYSGHYFCYVRTSAGMWYSLDDNQVTNVSEKTVFSREAYMLFYVRDRTYGLKGAVEVALKPDNSSAAGNKATPVVERKPSTAAYSRELVPAMGASLQQSVKYKGLLFHDNEQVEMKSSCSQVGDDDFTNRKQTAASQEPANPLPFDDDKKGNATNENAQNSALAHRMETDHSSPQSNTMNDSIQKEAVFTIMTDNQNDCPKGHESYSSNLQLEKGGERFLNMQETKPVESFPPATTVSCVQQETHADIITENLLYDIHHTESKLKKLRKSSSLKGPYFGRKKLFFMSLHLPKNKKMQSKKHHLISKKKLRKMIVDPKTDSNGVSTSEIFQAIDVCSDHLSRKDSHSNHYRKSKGKIIVKHGSSSVHSKEFNRTMKAIILETSNKSSMFCSSEEDSVVKGKYAEATDTQKLSDLLMATFKQTFVAAWDGENFPSEQLNETEYSSKRNIGHLLDECDDGKRKKLKKSRRCNPFQDAAIFKTQ